MSLISSSCIIWEFVNKLVKDTNAFSFVFDRFIDHSNIKICPFVTKVYKSHKKISDSINMGIIQVKMLQIQPENHFAIEIHV